MCHYDHTRFYVGLEQNLCSLRPASYQLAFNSLGDEQSSLLIDKFSGVEQTFGEEKSAVDVVEAFEAGKVMTTTPPALSYIDARENCSSNDDLSCFKSRTELDLVTMATSAFQGQSTSKHSLGYACSDIETGLVNDSRLTTSLNRQYYPLFGSTQRWNDNEAVAATVNGNDDPTKLYRRYSKRVFCIETALTMLESSWQAYNTERQDFHVAKDLKLTGQASHSNQKAKITLEPSHKMSIESTTPVDEDYNSSKITTHAGTSKAASMKFDDCTPIDAVKKVVLNRITNEGCIKLCSSKDGLESDSQEGMIATVTSQTELRKRHLINFTDVLSFQSRRSHAYTNVSNGNEGDEGKVDSARGWKEKTRDEKRHMDDDIISNMLGTNLVVPISLESLNLSVEQVFESEKTATFGYLARRVPNSSSSSALRDPRQKVGDHDRIVIAFRGTSCSLDVSDHFLCIV
jgi:hypothetical protein